MKENAKLESLSKEELLKTEGGIVPLLIAGATLLGAWYGAGYAVGVAIKNYEKNN